MSLLFVEAFLIQILHHKYKIFLQQRYVLGRDDTRHFHSFRFNW